MRTPAPEATLVLGLDLGTTGIKALLIDVHTGIPVGEGYRAYPSSTAGDGKHEQSPADWWGACAEVVRAALGATSPTRVAGVGLSGHMHAVVLVDEQDRYVRPAMTWADRRCTDQVARLDTSRDRFTERCANPLVEAFSAPKVAWLAEHEPESLERAVRLVQPKDSLRHRLTATWGTDVTDARGTLLYDLHREEWSAELWELCGASPDLGPSVSKSTAVVGEVTGVAAKFTGLAPGTPVIAGAGDVACSALGAGVVEEGIVYINAGTAAQVMTPLKAANAGAYFVFGRADSQAYLAMASVYAAGLSVDWAARTIVGGSHAAELSGRDLDAMALSEVAGASGAVFVPHLLGTSVPTHDPHLRGALLGLGADQRPSTVARAVLEGVGYACAAAARQVTSLGEGMTAIRLGGGLASSQVLRETLVAIADVPVHLVTRDASAVGAAMLAGIGIGSWSSSSEAAAVCVDRQELRIPSVESQKQHRAAQHKYDVVVETLLKLGDRLNPHGRSGRALAAGHPQGQEKAG